MPLPMIATAPPTATRYFDRPSCPQCGDLLLLPETAEFIGERRIRHRWACDECGHAFTTEFRFVRR